MTLQILTRFPAANATTAARDTYVFVGATNDLGGISADTLRVTIQGVTAYDGAAGFARPEFDGTVFLTNNYVAVRVEPRRWFAPGERVTVVATITDTLHPPVATLTDTFVFDVAPRPPTVVNVAALAPCQLRFVTPFPTPALDFLRQLLGATLTPDLRLVSVVAAYRLDESSARPLLVPLQMEPPVGLLDRDLLPLLPLDEQLRAQQVLWEPALAELRGLGVGDQTVETLRRAMATGYPQNRVGAACGATLLAAAFLVAQGK